MVANNCLKMWDSDMFVIKSMRTMSFVTNNHRRHAIRVAICIYMTNLQRRYCGENRLCIVNGYTWQTHEWTDDYTKMVVWWGRLCIVSSFTWFDDLKYKDGLVHRLVFVLLRCKHIIFLSLGYKDSLTIRLVFVLLVVSHGSLVVIWGIKI